MGRKSRFESKALKYAYNRYMGKDREKAEAFEEALANSDVARKIYDLRAKAGLTQKELAKLVGTTPSVISRLEDADYDGHSLAMLRCIAAALDRIPSSLGRRRNAPSSCMTAWAGTAAC